MYNTLGMTERVLYLNSDTMFNAEKQTQLLEYSFSLAVLFVKEK